MGITVTPNDARYLRSIDTDHDNVVSHAEAKAALVGHVGDGEETFTSAAEREAGVSPGVAQAILALGTNPASPALPVPPAMSQGPQWHPSWFEPGAAKLTYAGKRGANHVVLHLEDKRGNRMALDVRAHGACTVTFQMATTRATTLGQANPSQEPPRSTRVTRDGAAQLVALIERRIDVDDAALSLVVVPSVKGDGSDESPGCRALIGPSMRDDARAAVKILQSLRQ